MYVVKESCDGSTPQKNKNVKLSIQTKNPPVRRIFFSKNYIVLASGYSPRTGLGPSTIAANELNGRVRDGNGCDLVAWDTKTVESFVSLTRR